MAPGRRRHRRSWAASAIGLMLATQLAAQGLAAAAPTAPRTPADGAVQAGRALFHEGHNRQGLPLQASVGAGVELSGDRVACARCHGDDGEGRREGGLTAPSLRWLTLTQARPASAGLLPRGAYDEARLLRALREGLDADGRPLASAMPRLSLSPRDEADLLSYLRVVGGPDDRDPGVEADRLVLGGVLPLSGPLAPLGRAADAAIRGCFEVTNRAGGVFGRRIAWQVVDALDPAGGASLLPQQTLAVIAPWWGDLGSDTLAQRLPGLALIGPLGAAAELASGSTAAFAVVPQLSDQARVLVDAIAERPDNASQSPTTPRRLALIAAPGAVHRQARIAALRQAEIHPGVQIDTWPDANPNQSDPAVALRDASAWAAQWAIRWAAQTREPAPAVLVLGPPAWLRAVAESTARADGGGPLLLASVNQAGRDLASWPAPLRVRLRLAQPQLDAERLDPSLLQHALASVSAPLDQPAVQALAHASACLTVEALRRAGTDVSRARLRTALESIQGFGTGLVGPLTYGRGRRVGSTGSAVMRVDPQGNPQGMDRRWQIPHAW